MSRKQIYLDFAAATPVDEVVFAAMNPYFNETFFNPSAPYQPAREVRNDIENSRHQISQIIGCRSTEIVFTAGATESINLALSLDGHIVTTNIEHAAVLAAVEGRQVTLVKADNKGRVSPYRVVEAIEETTTLVSVGYVNNEIGTVQDIKAIAQVVDEEWQKRIERGDKTPIYFHTDASQAAGIVDIHSSRLGVDMMTLNSGKIYGPKQVGLLYKKSSVQLEPFIKGGGQEQGLRSGTENFVGVVGFAKALEKAERKRKQEVKRFQGIRKSILSSLSKEFDDMQIIGDQKRVAPHILSIAFPGLDAERLLFQLEAEGILVATGSACAANKDARSHVLTALGLIPDVIDGSLRLSFGRSTTNEDIERAVKILTMVIKKERARVEKS